MASDRPVGWGILGLANITRRILPALQQAANARLVALASHRPAIAAERLADQPAVRCYEDYAALLADPEVEAIYCPLPNSLHVEWCQRAAAAGKHILCEKPLATSLADTERLVTTVERQGVLLMEGFMWRFHPQHARVRSLLTTGAIGQPRLVRASLSFAINRQLPNIRLTAELGGGAIWDLGCYAVSIARFLYQAEPLTISAVVTRDEALALDLSLAAVATFPDGRLAQLYASMEALRGSSYEVVGSGGALRIAQLWLEPEQPSQLTLTGADGQEQSEQGAPANHFTLEIEHFSAAVRGQTPLAYGPADALAQMRALAALERALTSGRAERP
jgi:predicted dehydrogenase